MIRVIHKTGIFLCSEIKIDTMSKTIKFININQNLKYSIIFDDENDLMFYFNSIKHLNEIDLNDINYKHLKSDFTGHLE